MKSVGVAIDKAALVGTGDSGQPVGLTTLSSVASFSGTGAGVSTFSSAFVSLGDALDSDTPGVACNLTTAGVLRNRPEYSGSSKTMWEGPLTNGLLIDYPARASTVLPSGMAIVGNWKYLVIAVWAGGVELQANPFGDQVTGVGNFLKGVVGYRAMATIDVGVIFPAAFTYASAVT